MKNHEKLKKIAVLMGGTSNEREVSLNSGREVYEAFISLGYQAEAIDTKTYSILDLKKDGFTAAFIALHGNEGENGTVQAVLETLDIPYTGSGVQASALTLNKHFCKVIWRNEGIPVADYYFLNNDEYLEIGLEKLIEKIKHLSLPLIVKPNQEGSSNGVTKVKDYSELADALSTAFSFDHQILIEVFIDGREFSVPIIEGDVYPSIRIKPATELYDYQAKYIKDDTNYFCPSGLSEESELYIRSLAKQAYHISGCEGWARIDFMQSESDEKFFILEANISPGMTSHSLVPKSANSIGISFAQLVEKIMFSAISKDSNN